MASRRDSEARNNIIVSSEAGRAVRPCLEQKDENPRHAVSYVASVRGATSCPSTSRIRSASSGGMVRACSPLVRMLSACGDIVQCTQAVKRLHIIARQSISKRILHPRYVSHIHTCPRVHQTCVHVVHALCDIR